MIVIRKNHLSKSKRLWVRSIKKNTENTKINKGIENLFPIGLFKDEFYSSRVEIGDYGEKKTIEDFKKREFCDWICENGSVEDFEKFDRVVEIIREFFGAT